MTFYYGQYYFKYIEKKFWLCCLCFLFFLQFFLPNAFAGAQAQRAVQAVKKLIAEGKIPKDATLRIVAKEGNITNFWGHRMALKSKRLFENYLSDFCPSRLSIKLIIEI